MIRGGAQRFFGLLRSGPAHGAVALSVMLVSVPSLAQGLPDTPSEDTPSETPAGAPPAGVPSGALPPGFPAGGPPPGFPAGGPPPGFQAGALPPGAPGAPGAGPPDMKMLKPLPPPKPGSRAPSTDPRNLEGVYTSETMPQFFNNSLPLTAAAAEREARDRERMAQGKPTGGLSAICRPQPTFALGSDLFPGEVTQTSDQVIFLNEEHRTRLNVYLDRDHPKDLKPSYFGDSVGRWEGDTLVIDTIGFNGRDDKTSPKAHVVMRVRKVDNGQRLEIVTTTDDPETYTRPITNTAYSRWNPDVQMLEFQCEENLEGAMEGLNVSE